MSRGPVLIAGDVHLGAVPADRERAFVAWLEYAGGLASEIVINGDLFDFWFEYRSAVPRGHTRVLGALAALTDAGLRVRFMGGNHDWWGGSYLRDEIGLTLHKEPVVIDLAGHRTLLAHGDGLGRGDLGYRLVRLVLRGGLTRWAFRWLHPDVGAWIARRVSSTESRSDRASEAVRKRAEVLEEWALKQLRSHADLDLVLLGHTHVPTLLEAAPGRFYVNGGDWVHHRSFVVLEEDAPPMLREWEED